MNDKKTIEFHQSCKQDSFVFDESRQIWYDSKINLGGEMIASVKINLKDKIITLDAYKIPAKDENSSDVYYADCSESPYTFEFVNYAGQRFEILSKIK